MMAALAACLVCHAGAGQHARAPDVLVLTVDTLRYDHLSINGDPRPISPHLDGLLAQGLRFTQARTVEPLTSPAICSLFTSRQPHQHGSTRNGLRMQPGLSSMPRVLQAAGWRTAAFVSNWTLRDKLSGLGAHFSDYEELLTEKRWFGMVRGETSAPGLTKAVLRWLDGQPPAEERPPLMIWVHYSDPHAPYEMHEEYADALGIESKGSTTPRDRYAMEVAFTDAAIGDLLQGLKDRGMDKDLIVLFAADHGESLGENDYWGHGKNLREAGLRIPMGLVWAGRISPRVVEGSAQITDLSPTVLALLGLEIPREFEGYDWSEVAGGSDPPEGRTTYYQVHRGAVMTRHASQGARRSGLLEVAAIREGRKEILSLTGPLTVFDLRLDPSELSPLEPTAPASIGLMIWLKRVQAALTSEDAGATDTSLTEEELEKLRSLGYVD